MMVAREDIHYDSFPGDHEYPVSSSAVKLMGGGRINKRERKLYFTCPDRSPQHPPPQPSSLAASHL